DILQRPAQVQPRAEFQRVTYRALAFRHRCLRRQLRVITVVVGPVEGRREVANISRLPVVTQLEVHTSGTGGATVHGTCINDVLDYRGQHTTGQRATVVQHCLNLGIGWVAGDVVRIDGI